MKLFESPKILNKTFSMKGKNNVLLTETHQDYGNRKVFGALNLLVGFLNTIPEIKIFKNLNSNLISINKIYSVKGKNLNL